MSSSDSGVHAGHVGIGIGSALAIAISFTLNKSIGWAILHGIFGWFYVIYYGFCLDKAT